jgi:hypothetical protein
VEEHAKKSYFGMWIARPTWRRFVPFAVLAPELYAAKTFLVVFSIRHFKAPNKTEFQLTIQIDPLEVLVF